MIHSVLRSLLALSIALAATSSASAAACFRGINLSGAEFGALGGKVDHDYTWPSTQTLDYFAGKGFNTIRLPFRWERLQPKLMGELDGAELQRLMETIELIRARGMRTILDPHNYARYNELVIGSKEVPAEAFADFWAKLARYYANDDEVVFGLMNEPSRMPVTQWLEAANAATKAIREKARASNLILVPGTAWTGAHSWMTPVDGEPNGVVMKGFKDPADNFIFEFHQYLDDDFSGTKGNCSRAKDAEDSRPH